ncbi:MULTISPECIES: GntR family transcriptional regulator [unclassified Mesorhizobium]|uniref:GntR family transcriptional regulator n=1 Tax=unclassified Mesorhizobium TaxID=325217 RepID=UPI0006FC7CFC|nr:MULTISPECIES: GntR family transcriptional regulator [unclassified Mesorhizobium]KQZ13462.1 GntR family transcriptional regulator [Mesorhizobium sp. Root1471]KQZ35974.1 GntR family transcriptional regulator [Mesorhizobium sp. Root554]MDR7032314.1 DNA-binding GntR family transcriptional regulator [Mesorhizobium sp. BE184]
MDGSPADAVETRPTHTLEPIKLKSLREHVHDSLRQAIIAGRLKAGMRLNERQLASELGISTSPLKEALRQLESEGLVRTEARRGTFVTFSARQAEEMTLARAALESIIARQAAKHGAEDAFDGLRSIIEEMRTALASGDVQDLIVLNEKFHDAIHEASGCEYLRRLQNAQRMYDHAARVTVLSREEVRRASFLEHEAIMQAIVTRDTDRAERLMREHIVLAGNTHIELVF